MGTGIALKSNFGSFKDILMKFGLIVNLADLTIYIKFYKGMAHSFLLTEIFISFTGAKAAYYKNDFLIIKRSQRYSKL